MRRFEAGDAGASGNVPSIYRALRRVYAGADKPVGRYDAALEGEPAQVARYFRWEAARLLTEREALI